MGGRECVRGEKKEATRVKRTKRGNAWSSLSGNKGDLRRMRYRENAEQMLGQGVPSGTLVSAEMS